MHKAMHCRQKVYILWRHTDTGEYFLENYSAAPPRLNLSQDFSAWDGVSSIISILTGKHLDPWLLPTEIFI